VTSNMVGGTAAPHVHVAAAIEQLAATDGVLSKALAGLTAVIAEEALRNAEFRSRLNEVLADDVGRTKVVAPRKAPVTPAARASKGAFAKATPKRRRRAPGPWDPYDVYAEVGEAGLRDRLSQVELEQLRDIVAEHGMNTDGLAMRWTKVDRVVGRIVERVVDRAAKGDAFRSA
jgi:hypothetical protein